MNPGDTIYAIRMAPDKVPYIGEYLLWDADQEDEYVLDRTLEDKSMSAHDLATASIGKRQISEICTKGWYFKRRDVATLRLIRYCKKLEADAEKANDRLNKLRAIIKREMKECQRN